MAIFNLFSYRQQAAEGKLADVYSYDKIPDTLRVQIAHIWKDAIGPFHIYGPYETGRGRENNEGWKLIHETVAREHGVFSLGQKAAVDKRCIDYLLNEIRIEYVLDLVEVSFKYIDNIARHFQPYERKRRGINSTADEAIDELNGRFSRAGIGYKFEAGIIFRVDSELTHNEITLPALRFLQKTGFEGPCQEFLKAHSHYRNHAMKDAIINANNAFESTLKAICAQRHWEYPRHARAHELIRVVRENGVLPDYLDNSFDQLVATLKSGLPKVRNAEGAHGQGVEPRETPHYVVRYALHMAAAKILFLVEAHESTQ